MRTTILIALMLLAMSHRAASEPIAVEKRKQVGNLPPQGKIPKQNAQFGKPPRKLHNRGIGNGHGRKNR